MNMAKTAKFSRTAKRPFANCQKAIRLYISYIHIVPVPRSIPTSHSSGSSTCRCLAGRHLPGVAGPYSVILRGRGKAMAYIGLIGTFPGEGQSRMRKKRACEFQAQKRAWNPLKCHLLHVGDLLLGAFALNASAASVKATEGCARGAGHPVDSGNVANLIPNKRF